jgi:haloalkane dehalogenase
VLRTPDERFANLPDFPFEPNYQVVNGYRVHYLDEGPRGGQPVLLLHGEPTWSYLYRKMIPVLTAAGYRCIVPDLIGFGRSDKPVDLETHTYAFHVDAMTQLVRRLELADVTFFGQDWGGLIGLRVVAENEALFARVVIGNTGLPVGSAESLESLPSDSAFVRWKAQNQAMIDRGDTPVGTLVASSVGDPTIAAAYDAPFPDPSYKAGPLIMPQRVPMFRDDPANQANREAWEVLRRWQKPFLTAFSDGDPITRGGYAVFQESVPGTRGHPATPLCCAGIASGFWCRPRGFTDRRVSASTPSPPTWKSALAKIDLYSGCTTYTTYFQAT